MPHRHELEGGVILSYDPGEFCWVCFWWVGGRKPERSTLSILARPVKAIYRGCRRGVRAARSALGLVLAVIAFPVVLVVLMAVAIVLVLRRAVAQVVRLRAGHTPARKHPQQRP